MHVYGNGSPLQDSYLGNPSNPMTEEPGGLQSKGCKELDMTEQLSTQAHIQCIQYQALKTLNFPSLCQGGKTFFYPFRCCV